jgi:separase
MPNLIQDALPDLLTPLLDTLFNLARLALDISKPETHQTSFKILLRAMNLPALGLKGFLDIPSSFASSDDGNTDLSTRLNYQRCVSSAFHNMGAALYQASKFAAASRFVKLGSQIGSYALGSYYAAGIHKSVDSEKRKLWTQLEDQIYLRWDLLGSCCIKTGERQVSCHPEIQVTMLTWSLGSV